MANSTLQELTRNDWTLIESKAKRTNFNLDQEIIKESARIDHLYIFRSGSPSVELKGTEFQCDSCDTRSGLSVARWPSSVIDDNHAYRKPFFISFLQP